MLIISYNDEALQYFGYQVNSNTLSYFPLKENATDKTGNRSLTLNQVTISNGYANLTSEYSYMLPSSSFWGSIITASVWFYYDRYNTGGERSSIFVRNGGDYHHLLIPWKNNNPGTVGFYNRSWYPGNKNIATGSWYNFVIVKNGTNEKIYVNSELVLDSNSSFDNNSYPISIIGNYTTSNGRQWAIGKMSDLIFENRGRSLSDIQKYFNMSKRNYGY